MYTFGKYLNFKIISSKQQLAIILLFQDKLTEGQKTKMQDNINRDSLEDKAKDLLKWANSADKNLKNRVSFFS